MDELEHTSRRIRHCGPDGSVAQWLGLWTELLHCSCATLDKLFTHIVQRLWCYNLMALYKSD